MSTQGKMIRSSGSIKASTKGWGCQRRRRCFSRVRGRSCSSRSRVGSYSNWAGDWSCSDRAGGRSCSSRVRGTMTRMMEDRPQRRGSSSMTEGGSWSRTGRIVLKDEDRREEKSLRGAQNGKRHDWRKGAAARRRNRSSLLGPGQGRTCPALH